MINKAISLFLLAGALGALYTGCTPAEKKGTENNDAGLWRIIGPGGGGATFIPTFSPTDPQRFLIRCDMTGSYLTSNGGSMYKEINLPGGAAGYAFDPADPSILYIGSATLHRSADGGKTWQQLFPSRSEMIKGTYSGDHADYSIIPAKSSLYEPGKGDVKNIRIDPAKNGRLYFSMDDLFFYSEDNGATWKKKHCSSRIDFIYTNGGPAKDEVYIFGATGLTIFKKSSGAFDQKDYPRDMVPAFSFTGGIKKSTGDLVFYTLHHDTTKPIDHEFGYSEVWVSDNRVNTWQKITDTLITNTTSGIKPSFSMLACAEKDADKAYLVTNRYIQKTSTALKYWYGALKTNDAGSSWQWCWKGGGGSGSYGVKDGQDAPNLSDAWVKQAFGGEYIRLIDVGVSPSDGNTAIVTDWYRTMKTMDGGSTWQQIYSRQDTAGGFTSRGLDVTTAYGVHFDPFDPNHIAISYTDIGYHHSFDGGRSWVRSATGVPIEWINTCYWVVFDPKEKNKVWSAWSGMHDFPRGKMTRDPEWKKKARGGICLSTDGGRTWQPSSSGMGPDAPVTCIVLDTTSPPGSRTLYAAVYSKGVFKSTDDGKTWTLKNKGIGKNTCAFELTRTSNGTLFLTVPPTPQHINGQKGREFYSGDVYRSVDGAESWTRLSVTQGNIFPVGMTSDPADPNHLFLACWSDISLSDLIGGDIAKQTGGNQQIPLRGGVFASTDGGDTWRSVFDKKQYVYDVTADPRRKGRFFINTFNGAAYMTDDEGSNWKKLKGYDFHWGQRPVIDIHSEDKIYLTTFGSSVWHGTPTPE